MRWVLLIVGAIMTLIGIVWALQGASVLLGSPMTGKPFWLIVGIVVAILGVALATYGWRRQSTTPQ